MAKKKIEKTEAKQERMEVDEIRKIITELGKQGNSPAQIGIILKKKHGVQKVKLLGKSITKILKENNIICKTDLNFIEEKIQKLENHFKNNKQDKRAQREIVRFIGRKKKLKKYLERKNKKR